jgi:ABC-type transport system involved in Fe-S cluster assembly fused permease/ATPase subunit
MDTLLSYETVHHNDAVPIEVERFGNYVAAYQNSEFLVLFSLNFLNITQNMVLTFGVLLVTLISMLQISVGMHTVAMFVGILGYFTQLQAPLQFFGSFYNQVQTNLVEAERMLDLVELLSITSDMFTNDFSSKRSQLLRIIKMRRRSSNALEALSFKTCPLPMKHVSQY